MKVSLAEYKQIKSLKLPRNYEEITIEKGEVVYSAGVITTSCSLEAWEVLKRLDLDYTPSTYIHLHDRLYPTLNTLRTLEDIHEAIRLGDSLKGRSASYLPVVSTGLSPEYSRGLNILQMIGESYVPKYADNNILGFGSCDCLLGQKAHYAVGLAYSGFTLNQDEIQYHL